MSRIGRAPITVPAGVTVTVGENNLITVKGPKGTLTYTAHPVSYTHLSGRLGGAEIARTEHYHEGTIPVSYTHLDEVQQIQKEGREKRIAYR